MTVTVIGDNTGDDYSGTEDTFLFEAAPNNTYGTFPYFYINNHAVGQHMVTLLAFPGMSNIPSSATVTNASIFLYLGLPSGAGDHTVWTKRILVFYNTFGSTWINRESPEVGPWTTPGALSDGNDRSASYFETIYNDTVEYKTFTGSLLVSDVQSFVNLDYNNYGWHFERIGTPGTGGLRRFQSSVGVDGERPYITITYTNGGTRRQRQIKALTRRRRSRRC